MAGEWEHFCDGMKNIAEACKRADLPEVAQQCEELSKVMGQTPQGTPCVPGWGQQVQAQSQQLTNNLRVLEQKVDELSKRVQQLEITQNT